MLNLRPVHHFEELIAGGPDVLQTREHGVGGKVGDEGNEPRHFLGSCKRGQIWSKKQLYFALDGIRVVLLSRLLQVKRVVPARGSSPPTNSGGGRSGRRNLVARTDLPETSATKGLKALVGKAAATSSDHVW